MDRIDQLRIFVRVAQSGGFTSAAEQMGIPRPTVSLAIQQLEKRLGTRLLSRTTRKVSLTPDGTALLARAVALIADSDELEQHFQPGGQALTGRLRVDMPSRIARRLVAPALPEFMLKHPDLEIELGSSDRAIDLVHEGVDCALRVGVMASSSLVARPLGLVRLISCASPAYLARHGMPATPEDLQGHRAVNYVASGSGGVVPWQWMEGGVLATQAVSSQVSVNNAETYIACCLAGLGLIQIPAYDVLEHLACGELIEVLRDWPAPPMPMQVVYPHRRHLSQRIHAFSSWLAQVLAPCLEAPKAEAPVV